MKYVIPGHETARLKFRLLAETDFDTWLELFTTADIAHFLGMADLKTPKEQCEKWFEISMNRYKNNLGGMNVLIDKNTGAFIGQCGLLVQELDGKEEMEVGYSIIPKYWNMGYASEAAIACRNYGFEHFKRDSIISIIDVNNHRSASVAKKNGMSLHKQTSFKGMNVNVFRITRNEWLELNKIIS